MQLSGYRFINLDEIWQVDYPARKSIRRGHSVTNGKKEGQIPSQPAETLEYTKHFWNAARPFKKWVSWFT